MKTPFFTKAFCKLWPGYAVFLLLLCSCMPTAGHAQQSPEPSPNTLWICKGDSALLSVDSAAYPPGSSFSWYKDGDLIQANTATASLFVTDTGDYTVTATNAGGCSSEMSNDIKVHWKTLLAYDDEKSIAPEETVALDIIANDSAPCAGINPFSIAIVHQPQNGGLSLQNGKAIYTPAIGFAGVDSFFYTVSDLNGNSSNVARVTIYVGSDPDTNAAAHEVLIYPNPVSDYLYIKGDYRNISKIMLITDRGRMLYETIPHSAVTAINVSNFAQAVYFVRVIFTNGQVSGYKVLKR